MKTAILVRYPFTGMYNHMEGGYYNIYQEEIKKKKKDILASIPQNKFLVY